MKLSLIRLFLIAVLFVLFYFIGHYGMTETVLFSYVLAWIFEPAASEKL